DRRAGRIAVQLQEALPLRAPARAQINQHVQPPVPARDRMDIEVQVRRDAGAALGSADAASKISRVVEQPVVAGHPLDEAHERLRPDPRVERAERRAELAHPAPGVLAGLTLGRMLLGIERWEFLYQAPAGVVR